MTLTVVRPDDLADRILDRNKHPQWQGDRTKMLYAWPTNDALWAKYAELWRDGMRADRGIADATEFYRVNREAKDEGASVAWPQLHHPDELSAIQHAMNLKLDRGEAAFWAEYQNEPLPEEEVDDDLLTADQIAAKGNGLLGSKQDGAHAYLRAWPANPATTAGIVFYPAYWVVKRGEVPTGCTHLTMFIDVQSGVARASRPRTCRTTARRPAPPPSPSRWATPAACRCSAALVGRASRPLTLAVCSPSMIAALDEPDAVRILQAVVQPRVWDRGCLRLSPSRMLIPFWSRFPRSVTM